ncbi:MAG TPA: hypothetical protein VG815_05435 [Chloroflexota bacterium]|jgi:hypothetical protein|nr:hypothetical protein [Chloroflexota bacterium]
MSLKPLKSAAQIRSLGAVRSRVKPMAGRITMTGIALVAVVAAATAPALASGAAKGQPQPEMYAFTVNGGGGTGDGSGVTLADGTLVLASISPARKKVIVCMLHPGDRTCASTTYLAPYHKGTNIDTFNSTTVEALTTGGKDVSIVTSDCCNIPPFSGDAVIFDSTNDGKSFSKEIAAGNISGVGAGTVADGMLIVGTYNSSSLGVQAFPFHPTSPVTSSATPNSRPDGNTALTNYKGGVLVASDDTSGNTLVEYAASGSNFNSSGSYKKIIMVSHEDLTGISGNALMTNPGGSLTHGERLRFLTGTSFGTWHKVPEPTNGDDSYFALQKVGGVVHVFFINRRHGYDVYSETTPDGVHWSPLTIYNPAVVSAWLVPVLNSIGSGVCFESDGTPLRAQPIMLPQSIKISLAHSKVKIGTKTGLKGTAYPRLKGQYVALQRLSSGSWYYVSSTSESASGTFSFTVPGASHTYRAKVADRPGYYQIGYSNSATLTATKK